MIETILWFSLGSVALAWFVGALLLTLDRTISSLMRRGWSEDVVIVAAVSVFAFLLGAAAGIVMWLLTN